jgi:hypothetical protein
MPAYDHLDQEQRMEIAEFIVSLADAAGEK